MRFLCFMIVSLLIGALPAAAQEAEPPIQTFVDGDITFDYPADWQAIPYPVSDTVLIVYLFNSQGAEDKFYALQSNPLAAGEAMLTLTFMTTDESLTAEAMLDQVIANPSYDYQTVEEITFAGMPATRAAYETLGHGAQDLFIALDDTLVLMTVITPVGETRDYEWTLETIAGSLGGGAGQGVTGAAWLEAVRRWMGE